MEALKKFEKPTPIQSVTWPVANSGRDMVGIAQTGSGKTLAFGLPLLQCLHTRRADKPSKSSSKPRSLVLAPTRELAMQIHTTLQPLAKSLNLGCVCIYGGVPKPDQQRELRKGCDVIVATPGRLVDFLGDGTVELHTAVFAVLDEADRMLDMGFEKDVREIMGKVCPFVAPHQTLYLSATWPPTVFRLAAQFLTNPVHITVGSQDLAANKKITQSVEVLEPFAKERRMFELLEKWIGKGGRGKGKAQRVLVFALYKKEATRLEQAILGRGYDVVAIHGDLTQPARTAALAKFRSGDVPLLVATDVAARGLDIPEVEYVLNYTFPLTIEDYVHRIGRTARAGRTGVSHTFFTMHDKAHSGALMNVLRDAGQEVPDDLKKFGGSVKKKVDKNFGAFYKEIDPNAKSSHVKFGEDDDE
ncbi:DEAD box RNA helicase [Gonapodya prolifera JEL478]|uniref:RNA helicase n=1 Tax=Gonapodya prolifera (strain JEL478) TaxID=1344416 RepID=A0A139AKA5_GONPJ|nr:DEAD box RNA helicase [Gonapodya prolifera JEL478]|eukprot:KXS17128.1 DEAD box RNA helicase [Gonapodya prolifera JEL478]